MALKQDVRAGDDIPRLRVIKAAGADDLLKFAEVRRRNGGQRRVLFIENGCDLVDARVRALRRKACGEEQLIGLFIVERALGERVFGFEAAENFRDLFGCPRF